MPKSMKGTFHHNIDSKGRLIIPSKLRDSLGTEFVVTQGLDTCLYLYSTEEWERFTEKLDQLGNSKLARDTKLFFRSNAADLEMDAQGRTLIPVELRESVGIRKGVVIVGSGEKAEIWSEEAWEEKIRKPEFSREYISQQLEASDLNF